MGPALEAVLAQSRDFGFLGPGPLEIHREHALGFADALGGSDGEHPRAVLDLGAGGGVPGLVLAVEAWSTSTFTLLDAGARRCAFLIEAVEELGLEGRIRVIQGRAEDIGRRPEERSAYDVVVARAFAPPPVTAECAAPFLSVGGHLVVSEPPGGDPSRWNSKALGGLGLSGPEATSGDSQFSFVRFRQDKPCPERYPRRVGIPAKRPLF